MRKWPLRIIAVIGLLCFIIGCVGLLSLYNKTDGFTQDLSDFRYEKKVDGTNIQQLTVNADSADIVIKPGKDNDIHIVFQGRVSQELKDDVQFSAEADRSDSLTVKAMTTKNFQMGINIPQLLDLFKANGRTRPKLDITVPDKVYRNLTLSNDIGSLRAESLQAQSAKMSTDIGVLTIIGFKGDSLKATTNTGQLSLENADASLDLTSDIGAIRLTLDDMRHPITATTDIGKIDVKFKSVTAIKLDINSDVGSEKAELPGLQVTSSDAPGIYGSIGSNGPLLKLRSDIGSISVTQQ